MPDTTLPLEQTLVLIKPDALKNSLTGTILSHFAEIHTGLRFAGMKVAHVHEMLAKEHYIEHKDQPFYGEVVDYIMGRLHNKDNPSRRRVIAIIYEGVDAVGKVRQLVGPTNQNKARENYPGCVRALGAVVPTTTADGKPFNRMDNLIHASATRKDAEREVKLWFTPHDLPPGMRTFPTEESKFFYFFAKDNGNYSISVRRAPQSKCIIAPGDIVWRSDQQGLEDIRANRPSDVTLPSIVAKYFLNEWSDA